jgi:hypothetical protein
MNVRGVTKNILTHQVLWLNAAAVPVSSLSHLLKSVNSMVQDFKLGHYTLALIVGAMLKKGVNRIYNCIAF